MTPPAAPVTVVVVDDEAMVRAGLRLIVGNAPDLEVVGEAVDGLDALDVVRNRRPDVLLMDVAMPRLDGPAAARRLLAQPDAPRIVMLTTFDTDENLHAALRAGVAGFLLKSAPPEQLIAALRAAACGDALIDPAVTSRVIASFAARPVPVVPPALATLTPRESEVLELVARGLSNAEIAGTLFVGEATVKSHLARVLQKLGLRDRIQAVVLAYEAGVVRPGVR